MANPAKWVSKGVNALAIWGEAQGSGSKPYQTQIDLGNIAFKCSCPSRKFPCKHGLGLMLFYAKQQNAFTETAAPAWVTEWLNKRAEKEEKKTTQEEKPVDEAAQAKRQQARQQKVSDGINELSLWIKDIVRNGIINMPEKGFTFFDNMAKRMVDAQAPGLAGMVRTLGETNFYAEEWQSGFLDKLLSIYLVTEGYKNRDNCSEAMQEEIRSCIGFTQNQDELKMQAGIVDTWLVLAKQTIEVDSITSERNWLYGTQSNQYALVLQFIVRGQGGQHTFTPGMFIEAELVFYPAVSPMRAIVKKQISSNAKIQFTAFKNWQQVVLTETTLCSQMPVRNERPFVVEQLTPVKYDSRWWLQDRDKKMMAIKNENKMIWKLLALSGGSPLNMVVIGKEDRYEPVAVWYNELYKIL